MTQEIPQPGDRVAQLERDLAAARAAAAGGQPYAGPAGAGSLSAPLAPPPPDPGPPPGPPAPHPGETFAPGDMGWYTYHDHRDREGTDRTQLVVVTHVDDDHVHAMVLGDSRSVASFAAGQLTHGHPAS